MEWKNILLGVQRGCQAVERLSTHYQLQLHFPTWVWDNKLAVSDLTRTGYQVLNLLVHGGVWARGYNHSEDILVVEYARINQALRRTWAALSRYHLWWTLSEFLPHILHLIPRHIRRINLEDVTNGESVAVPEIPMQAILINEGGHYWRGSRPWHVWPPYPSIDTAFEW